LLSSEACRQVRCCLHSHGGTYVTLKMETAGSSEILISTRRHDFTSQKTFVSISATIRTPNLSLPTNGCLLRNKFGIWCLSVLCLLLSLRDCLLSTSTALFNVCRRASPEDAPRRGDKGHTLCSERHLSATLRLQQSLSTARSCYPKCSSVKTVYRMNVQ
jgi:hypothetical protein